MTTRYDTFWCSGCGIEITWAPHLLNDDKYCCEDCAFGFRCKCTEKIDEEEVPGETKPLA